MMTFASVRMAGPNRQSRGKRQLKVLARRRARRVDRQAIRLGRYDQAPERGISAWDII